MSGRNTLTLKPVTSINPEKLLLADRLGLRFIDRKGRNMLQARTVIIVDDNQDYTWVDVPLVPETYA
jgi:hypothetical protein